MFVSLLGALGSLLEALGLLLGVLGRSWGALGSLLGALRSLVGGLGASGRFLEVPWKVAVGLGGCRREPFPKYKGWSFSTEKEGRVQKKWKGVKNIKNVAVAKVLLVFLKKSCCNQQTGGVPLQFVGLGTIFSEKRAGL